MLFELLAFLLSSWTDVLLRQVSGTCQCWLAPDSRNPFDQVDRFFRPWHGGDLALQTTGVRAVAGFLQKSENALPHGRCVDVPGRQAKPGTRCADKVADDVLILSKENG